MVALIVYTTAYSMHCILNVVASGEKELMKTSDYILLYIVCIAIIYGSVGVMMETWG